MKTLKFSFKRRIASEDAYPRKKWEETSMKWTVFMILLISLAVTTPASAQFYKYLDKQGNVRFTDDINQVPENQRNHIRSYAAASSDAADATASEGGVEKKAVGSHAADEASANAAQAASAEEDPLDSTRTRLEAMKKQIDADYQALASEKEALGKEKEVPKTQAQVADYNKRVAAFNQKAGDYEARSNELRKQVEAYNARVIEENAKLAQSVKK
jgi:hypothetical protein